MNYQNLPILSIVTFFPLIGIFIIFFIRKESYSLWEVMLVPMYFIIGIWGGPRRLYAAIKFFLYTMFGSSLMLVAILVLYFINHSQTGVYSFSIPKFFGMNLSMNLQFWLFLA